MERNEISNEFKWNLDMMYPDKTQIETDMEIVKANIAKFPEYKGRLSESEDIFYNALKTMEDSSRKLSKLVTYSNMKHHEDTRINENLARSTKVDMLASELSQATSYVTPEIIAMDDKKLEEFLNIEKIKHYKHMIDEILRAKPHTLSEAEEKIMAAVGDLAGVPENTYEMLTYADMQFPEITDEKGEKVRLDHFNYSQFIKSPDRRVREEAFNAEFETYKKYSNTMASTLFGGIKAEVFNAKMRNYPSARYASLYADNISLDVYDNLIESVHENIPAMDKYLEIKRKFFGLDKMHMYDLYLPMARDFKMEIKFEEAKEIILKALEPLGEDYLNIIRRAFDEKWIDVYPNEGKRGGAYSWGCYDSVPYILMSYKDDLNSMFTLIHELGHSAHSYLSRKTQEYIYSGYTLFVAEVASTVNENLLVKYLLKNAKSKEEKIYILNYYLEQFRTTLFRQTLFAEFEKISHAKVEEGTPLTAGDFTKIFEDLNKLYYGNVCEIDELIGYEWARIPHFYSNFYVYKYATGISAATVLSQNVLEGGEKVKNYLNFLKDGGMNFPLDQLRSAGVDMEKKESVDSALKIFNELVNELEELV